MMCSSAPLEIDVLAMENPADLHDLMAELESRREDRRQLAAAIEAGVSTFDIHQQIGVARAALWCVDDMSSQVWKLLTTPGSRILRVVRRSPVCRGPRPTADPLHDPGGQLWRVPGRWSRSG